MSPKLLTLYDSRPRLSLSYIRPNEDDCRGRLSHIGSASVVKIYSGCAPGLPWLKLPGTGFTLERPLSFAQKNCATLGEGSIGRVRRQWSVRKAETD